MFVEPAAAASVAGVAAAKRSGYIDRSGPVVCLLTGHGLKYQEAGIRPSSRPWVMSSSWFILSGRTSAGRPDRCTRDRSDVSQTEDLSVGNDDSDRTSLSAARWSRAAVEISPECSGSGSGRY